MPVYRIGQIVRNPKVPDWGLGRILAISGSRVTAYFLGVPETKRGDAVKTVSLDHVTLEPAEDPHNPWLDNLPPFKDGKLKLPKPRLTFLQARDLFLKRFPGGFNDPTYCEDEKRGERKYKLKANARWTEELGGDQYRRLLADGDIEGIVQRLLRVEGPMNLVSPHEKMALRDALKDIQAATRFATTLLDLLEAKEIGRQAFDPYAEAVKDLPAEPKRARVATWPVATFFPYIAQPDRFMFLKPDVTKECAQRLAFELHYDATPNWYTYDKLLEMSRILMQELKPLGARDMIDVQSFIWVVASKTK